MESSYKTQAITSFRIVNNMQFGSQDKSAAPIVYRPNFDYHKTFTQARL